jgi:hypothetical protein
VGDYWLILIPTDPEWVPDTDQAAKTEQALERLTQGFAFWSVRVHYANRGGLNDTQREQVQAALGHPVREIRLHL